MPLATGASSTGYEPETARPSVRADSEAPDGLRLRTERLRTMGYLLAGAPHELSNPLTAILGYAELGQRLATAEELSEYLDGIAKQAARAAAIVENLLRFAQDRGHERRSVSLNDVVANALRLRQYDVRGSNTEIRLDLGESMPNVAGDSSS